MALQSTSKLLCFSSTLFLLQTAVLAAQLPLAEEGRNSWWLQSQDQTLEESSLNSDPFLRWRRDSDPPPAVYEDDDGDSDDGNCSKIDGSPRLELYNDSRCEYVKEECEDKFELFNYLRFSYCSLVYKEIGFIFFVLWLFYLLLILSTTVDNFFVPVLKLLAKKLHLPPSIAGMTLLALGNGAPDIFVAFSALQDDDLPLMLGALLGAGLFIVTVVLGTVLLASPSRNYNIKSFDFMRDLIAYVLVLVIIVAVAYDGKVTLAEAICFPLLYIGYVAFVVGFSYIKKYYLKKKEEQKARQNVHFNKEDDDVVIDEDSAPNSVPNSPMPRPNKTKSITKSADAAKNAEQSYERSGAISEQEEITKSVIIPPLTPPKKVELIGLTIPKSNFKKVLYILEFPISVLRWLTIPPCAHDDQWSVYHFIFAVISPVPMSLFLLLVGTGGWSGFTRTVGVGFPVPIIVVLCVCPLCPVLFFTLSWKKPPHWIMQTILMVGAFVMSVAWLNVIANEVVSVLQAMGLLVGISTAILGLTVLAIGNSVADWVADTLVAKGGHPEMALGSVFGAPLITHVLGLTLALMPKVYNGDSYTWDIKEEGFIHVKMAWIFLGIVLFGSVVVFPLFKFKPPREYSLVIVYVYVVFMIFSVLIETKVFDIKL